MIAFGTLYPSRCERTAGSSVSASTLVAGRGHDDRGDRLGPALVRQADHDRLRDVLVDAAYSAFSTSIDATFSPPVLMTSLRRSVNHKSPSASKRPMSPEWNQPCSKAAVGRFLIVQVAVSACGPR